MINISIYKFESLEADYQSAYQTLMKSNGRFSSLSTTKPGLSTAANNIDKYQKNKSNEKVANRGSVAEAAGAATPNNPSQVFTATSIIDGKNPEDLTFQKNFLAVKKAFLYIIEVFMLVLALVAPMFVGLSMFPVGNKPLVSWAAMFLAAGFCKICYTLICGLSAVAMVLTGPENIDMSIFAIIVGGMAPILAVTITSILTSSFSSAIGAIAWPAQGYGVNAGLTSGVPPGQPQNSGKSTGNRGDVK